MRVLPVDFVPVAVTTAAVYRVVEDGRSTFVKILQSPRHSPMSELMPADLVARFPWRAEADFLLSGFELPPGMRMPGIVRVDELGDDRVALWLEDVECADVPWDLPRFVRAARGLGRWSGRRFGGAPGGAFRVLASGLKILGRFEDDPRLVALEREVPGWLDRMDALPQAYGHGDACPQNLLVPRDDPDSFVVIDVTWEVPHPVGADLGQLLVGLVHDGVLEVSALPELRAAVIEAYAAGLRDEGKDVPVADVAFGCDAALVIRSGFTSGPELTEYLVELGSGLVGAPGLLGT